jgi:hypothetical protein
MRASLWFAAVTAVLLGLVGCGQQGGAPQLGATPDAAVKEFLGAVKAGDSKRATELLTPLTRQKTAEMNLNVTPDPSQTASFAVGQVEYVTDTKDGAHVASQWTDKDEEGNSYSRDYLWILRKETEGWRIAGMAARVFPDAEPLILNFEDPEDMVRKQQLLAEEIARREAEPNGGQQQAGQQPPVGGQQQGVEQQARQPGAQPDRR